MKKIIFNLIVTVFLLLTISLGYLTFFGVKTSSFNDQIQKNIYSYNKDIKLDINQVQIRLNLKKFNIEVKTLSPIIYFRNKKIEIESIKTLISLKSFVNKEFALKNLYLSTKSIKLDNLTSLFMEIKKMPELYLLKNSIKNGFLVADIQLNFNENGDIKDDFKIDGYIRNGQINFSNQLILSKIDFIFNIANDQYDFKDIKFLFTELNFSSKKISVKKGDNDIFVKGSLENKNLDLTGKSLSKLIKYFDNDYGIKRINFSSKNDFSFKIGDKYNFNEIDLISRIKLKNFSLENKQKKGKYFFPEIKNQILLKDHEININLNDGIFSVDGNGDIFLQKEADVIQYKLKKINKLYKINSIIELTNNPFQINFLNFKKKLNNNSTITIDATLNELKEINFKRINVKENQNQILFENIFLEKDFKIQKIDVINLNYIDNEDKKNILNLSRKDDEYYLKSTVFNANSFLSKLLENEDSSENQLFANNFNLGLEFDRVYLSSETKLNNLIGKIQLVNNKVEFADINGIFDNGKNITFSIKSDNDQKVTTLFSSKAEPLVERYKFIKGYEGGYLDFYSVEKNGKSNSTLKLFDFKLQELPALTKLLTLASLQGIADTLSGEGIRFNELEMNFKNERNVMTIEELYVIGPAISVLMSGYIETGKLVSLRGTLVPATTINKTIGSIPILGKILVGSKTGEGVFGVSFKIKGHPDKLETSVNPLKTLTPRFITRTLEKIKKTN